MSHYVMHKLASIFFILFILIGISNADSLYQKEDNVSENETTLYIYRPNLFFNVASSPSVFLDDQKLFDLRNNTYSVVHISPGEHTLLVQRSMPRSRWYAGPMTFTHSFKANETYYIRISPEQPKSSMQGEVVAKAGNASIMLTSETAAQPEISKTRRLN
ncbi:MAG: DUF2846 domain-containing protein [Pseudomonadota bacterium]